MIKGRANNLIDFLDLDLRTGPPTATDPIVLLHGIGCTWHIWNRQIARLATTRRVLGVNLRGSGQSEPGPQGVTIADMAADVHALLGQMSIPSATIMGLSMGGMVAMQHAIDFPDDVSRLLIVGSTAGVPAELLPVAAEQRLFIEQHDMDEIAESRTEAAFGAESDPEIRQWSSDMIASTDLDSYRAQAAAAFDFHIVDQLHQISVPTHILHGKNDMSLPIGLGQAIHEGIHGATFHAIESPGHFPNLEVPQRFNSVLDSLLIEKP